MVTEHLVQAEFGQNDEKLMEIEIPPESDITILEDLSEVVFKLRAFTESAEEGDISLGIELGMQRAADMIENVINRHARQGE